MLIVSARLAPENGAALITAIEATQHAARDAAEKSGRPGPPTESPAEDTRHSPAEDTRRDEEPARPGCSRVEALAAICGQILADGPRPTETADTGRTHQVVIHVDHHALNSGDGHDDTDGRCHLDNGPSIHPHTLRRMTCQGGVAYTAHYGDDGTPLDVGRASRTVPAKLRRAVLDRARSRCQYPGCEHRSWLQIHHVHHWIDGGPTAYANLAVMCSAHHRAHHTGAFTITHDKRAPGHFRFHLPDGRHVDHAPRLSPPHRRHHRPAHRRHHL